MGSSDQNDKQDEEAHPQYSRQFSNAIRNVLTKISKLKNTVGTTTGDSQAAMVAGPSNSDPSAANTSNDPASPRPAHISTFDGSGGNATNADESAQPPPTPPPDPVVDAQGAHVEDNQHPHPGLIFGNYGPPPGFTSANLQAEHQATAGNQHPQPGQVLGTRGFRRLPPPPGFGPPFGNRRYPPGFRPPVMFEKCFSLASTRIYDNRLYCDRCGGRSDLGWFYRCCHDTDARLYESIKDGNKESFDKIGEMLTRDLRPPERGAAARQDKLSPLKEMSPEQLKSYSSEQLQTVLKQHENAVNIALSDRYGPFVSAAGDRPYLVGQAEECSATLCPRCGRGGMGEDLAWLSIDGVLKGDVPATAAVGYGFRALGGRPVADANIVKNLGLRDPETGELPEKMPPKDYEPDVEALEGKAKTEDFKPEAPVEADKEDRPSKVVEGSGILAMGDWQISPETDRLDRASIMADKGSETNEDLIDFYVSSEGKDSGNSGQDVTTETKRKESPESAQNDKPEDR